MMPRSDIQIREELLRALKWDTRITVAVKDGAVTLTGTVDSHVIRLLILEEAHFIEGVFSVTNDIVVNSPNGARTDLEIAHAVRTSFEWDAMIPEERIKVTVTNGWVGLAGEVDLLREREEAERVSRCLAGVRGVYNEITVNPPEARTENVREAIEVELRQRASLEAERIQILLRDGTVTLSGQVHSWEEECAIVKAAGHAPGVESINDRLSIEP
jgi:osmotically-inducible protein OsmY